MLEGRQQGRQLEIGELGLHPVLDRTATAVLLEELDREEPTGESLGPMRESGRRSSVVSAPDLRLGRSLPVAHTPLLGRQAEIERALALLGRDESGSSP